MAALIHYPPGDIRTQAAPLRAFRLHRAGWTADCSQEFQANYYAAECPDPAGVGWRSCFTGTLLDNLPHISEAAALPGDGVVFVTAAQPQGAHVVILTEKIGGAWRCVSQGSEADPRELELSFVQAAVGGSEVFLQGLPAPPAAEVWRVHDGAMEVLGATKHPVGWANEHPRAFRRHQTIRFDREVTPK